MSRQRVKCGDKLFEGAQATIYRYEGVESPPPAGAAEEEDGFQLMLDGDEPLCVKVMGSRNCPPDGLASRLVGSGQLVEAAELQETYAAAMEATTLAHEGLIPYLLVDLVDNGTCLMMVMPLRAADLLRWVAGRGQAVSESSLLHISEQLASAVAYLHSKNIWHLDLSLRNVLVSSLSEELPQCMLIDMETSTMADRNPSPHFTMEFSAPERATAPSEKCDVFSLGVMIFCAGARHDAPGLVDDVPGLGAVTMNHEQLTPTRIAAVVRRDLKHCESLVSLVTMMLNHDAATRPSIAFVLENIRAIRSNRGGPGNRSLLSFPYVCGPFDLPALIPEAVKRIELHTKSDMYDAHVTCYRCGLQRSMSKHTRTECRCDGSSGEEIHLPGHTSPYTANAVPPTCSGAVQQALTTANNQLMMQTDGKPFYPADAVGYYYTYPMFGASKEGGSATTSAAATVIADPNSPELLLQKNGGFAFTATSPVGPTADTGASTESEIRPVPFSVRAFSPSGCGYPNQYVVPLYFTAAQPWPSECTQTLSKAGRIHTEVPSMLGTAQSYCWLQPGERFSLKNGEEWIPAEDGGFVFWFGDDPLVPNELDRFFAIAAPVDTLQQRSNVAGGTNAGPNVAQRFVEATGQALGGFGRALGSTLQHLTRATAAQRTTPPSSTPPVQTILPPGYPSPASSSATAAAAAAGVDPNGPNIAIYYRIVPVGTTLEVQTEPPPNKPSTFRIPVTGEYGLCGDSVYLSTSKIAAIGAPKHAKYMCFCRVDEASVLSQVNRRSSSDSPSSSRFFPQHGFFLLDIRFQVVALISLRITTSSSITQELRQRATRMEILCLPSSERYDGSLPPGELADVDTSTGLSPLLGPQSPPNSNSSGSTSTSRQGSGFDVVMSGGIGYLGYSSQRHAFFFSDGAKERWLVRQWSTVFNN